MRYIFTPIKLRKNEKLDNGKCNKDVEQKNCYPLLVTQIDLNYLKNDWSISSKVEDACILSPSNVILQYIC